MKLMYKKPFSNEVINVTNLKSYHVIELTTGSKMLSMTWNTGLQTSLEVTYIKMV